MYDLVGRGSSGESTIRQPKPGWRWVNILAIMEAGGYDERCRRVKGVFGWWRVSYGLLADRPASTFGVLTTTEGLVMVTVVSCM